MFAWWQLSSLQGQKSCFLTVFLSKKFFEKIFSQKFCHILKVHDQKRQYPKFQLKTSILEKVRAILNSKILSHSLKTRFFVSQFKVKKIDSRVLWFCLKLLRMIGTIDWYQFFMVWKQKKFFDFAQLGPPSCAIEKIDFFRGTKFRDLKNRNFGSKFTLER